MPQATLAQPRPTENFYKIHIFKEGDACFYEITGQTDQDLFVIAPYGIVDFEATGTNARVEIKDSDDNVPGTAREKELKLKDGGPPQSLRARGPRNLQARGQEQAQKPQQQSTEHQVYIRCCEGTALGRCSGAQEAEPVPAPSGMGAIEPSRPAELVTSLAGQGPYVPEAIVPRAPLRVTAPLGTGGPTMRVRDDD